MEAEPNSPFPDEPSDLFERLEREFGTPEKPTFFDKLIDGAYKKFRSNKTIELEDGSFCAYDTYEAAWEVLDDTGLHGYVLLGIIMDHTELTLKEALEDLSEETPLDECENLEELIETLNTAYISAELAKKYPAVREIERKRIEGLEE